MLERPTKYVATGQTRDQYTKVGEMDTMPEEHYFFVKSTLMAMPQITKGTVSAENWPDFTSGSLHTSTPSPLGSPRQATRCCLS
jgi:hypothetical protein